MNSNGLKVLVIIVFVLFVLYLIMKSRHNRMVQKRKEDSRFKFH